MPKVRSLDRARASVSSFQNFVSSKTVVHILFAVEGCFPKRIGTYAIGPTCSKNFVSSVSLKTVHACPPNLETLIRNFEVEK